MEKLRTRNHHQKLEASRSKNRSLVVPTSRVRFRTRTSTRWWWLMATMQHQDKSLSRIASVLRLNVKSETDSQIYTDYELKNNRLLRKVGGNLLRGHFGLEKTLQYIEESFWFARLRNFDNNGRASTSGRAGKLRVNCSFPKTVRLHFELSTSTT